MEPQTASGTKIRGKEEGREEGGSIDVSSSH